MSAHLEKLVREWREALKACERAGEAARSISQAERDIIIERAVAAHNALVKYADEEMGQKNSPVPKHGA
jgi:16S rRNA G527 N7-methylase RsmG